MSRFRPQSLQNLAVLLLFPSNLKQGLNFHHLCFVFGITLCFLFSFLFFLKPVFRQRLEQSFFSTVRVCQSFNATDHLALTERLKGSVTITLERTAPRPNREASSEPTAPGRGLISLLVKDFVRAFSDWRLQGAQRSRCAPNFPGFRNVRNLPSRMRPLPLLWSSWTPTSAHLRTRKIFFVRKKEFWW